MKKDVNSYKSLKKEENLNKKHPYRVSRGGKMNKKTKNLISLILGIVLILAGLSQTVINLSEFGLEWISIPPIASLIIGAILALMGGTRTW